jgi:hypothetical protein
MLSGHHPQDAAEICPASPLLIMSVLGLTLLAIRKVFRDRLQEWGFSMMPKQITVDEHLPCFYKAVKLSQADELIEEQTNMRENFGFQPTCPSTIRVLDATRAPKKAFPVTPWYQILSNPKYQQRFNYIGAFIPERE